jgi:hypothetical protein
VSDDIDNPVMRALLRWAEEVAAGQHAAALSIAQGAVELARTMDSPSCLAAAEMSLESTRREIAGIKADPCACSFCGALEGGGARLVAGPAIFICNACVVACRERSATYSSADDKEGEPWQTHGAPGNARCAFCARAPEDVVVMFAAAVGAICDRCVETCHGIMFRTSS